MQTEMLYMFDVKGAGSQYILWIQHTELEDAQAWADLIIGQGKAAELVESREGTYDDLLRPGFHDLIAKKFQAVRKRKWTNAPKKKEAKK